jgi:hypothetical protein
LLCRRRGAIEALLFALLKEVIDEGGVLVLGDAIADRAGIARHLEVLAEGPG